MKKSVKKPAKKKPARATCLPFNWKGTPDEWRALKRGEWAEVTRALDRYHFGCAYCPGGDELDVITRAAERLTEALEKDWVMR